MRGSAHGLDTPTADPLAWQARGLCKQLVADGDEPADLWFPEKDGVHQPEVKRAKRVCRACPIAQQCGEHGWNERWGIWGGFTYRERQKWKRRVDAERARDEALRAEHARLVEALEAERYARPPTVEELLRDLVATLGELVTTLAEDAA